ncbi:hypothetical protein LPJ77_006386, partial [Coemansia sp. RSA 2523]
MSSGNSLAAIAAISAHIKICTRTQDSPVACQISVNSNGVIGQIIHVARNQGTTVSVVQPLSKLPVRYNLVKAQSTRIKTSIREWMVAYCLANHTIGVSLAYTGAKGAQNGKSVLAFTGALSLNDAVLHFIGAKRSDAVICIEFPSRQNAGMALGSSTYEQLKDVAYEGTFACLNNEGFEVRHMPRLLLAINGTVCKPDALPGLAEQLQGMYLTEDSSAQ